MQPGPEHDREPMPTYYAAQSAPPPATTGLEGEHQADVVVIGAGLTGLSAALHLAECGAAVIVLEAREIGSGASGRNFGQVVPYLHRSPAEIHGAFPPETAERMITRIGAGPGAVLALLERYRIDAQQRRTGLLFAAHAASGLRTLEARARFWRDRGGHVKLYGPSETAALVGSSYYRACAIDDRGFTINPVAYVRGLAHAVAGLGVRIFTNSPSERPERDGALWKVRTGQGSVRAQAVVLATNAYTTRRLWPGLRDSIIPIRAYAMASAPISDNLRQTVLPGGHALTDTGRAHSGIRLNEEGCLHASAQGPPFAPTGRPDHARLKRRIAALYPQLAALELPYAWSGWIALSQDRYPHLHELAPGVWTGLGYTGRGLAAAALMGQDLAACLTTPSAAETTFRPTHLRRWWATPIARPIITAAIHYHRLRDALDR